MLLTGEAYCTKHFICLVDIVFSSAEEASAKRIREDPIRGIRQLYGREEDEVLKISKA